MDVETLFDSNLADVPMVYTVSADGQAVSINRLPAMEAVPFGVVCNSDEPVEVTIDHSALNLGYSSCHVLDAVLGTTTAVGEGMSVSIQPNDYGRYFLTAGDKAENGVRDVADGIVISVRNGVVTVTAQSNLSQVSAVNTGGAAMYEATDCGTSVQFQLRPGTYVIEAEGAAGKRMAKIIVK